jgi:hypothetical protein
MTRKALPPQACNGCNQCNHLRCLCYSHLLVEVAFRFFGFWVWEGHMYKEFAKGACPCWGGGPGVPLEGPS